MSVCFVIVIEYVFVPAGIVRTPVPRVAVLVSPDLKYRAALSSTVSAQFAVDAIDPSAGLMDTVPARSVALAQPGPAFVNENVNPSHVVPAHEISERSLVAAIVAGAAWVDAAVGELAESPHADTSMATNGRMSVLYFTDAFSAGEAEFWAPAVSGQPDWRNSHAI
jgi:hypothetical protein